jgi:hypothetical protein
VRNLKIETEKHDDIEAAINEIDKLYGMDSVSFDSALCVLNMAYDATRVNLENIEVVLNSFEIFIAHDWWTHLKDEYYRFVDQNVKDNANHEPWSCHKPPPRIKR